MFALVLYTADKKTAIVDTEKIKYDEGSKEDVRVLHGRKYYRAKIIKESYDRKWLEGLDVSKEGTVHKINKILPKTENAKSTKSDNKADVIQKKDVAKERDRKVMQQVKEMHCSTSTNVRLAEEDIGGVDERLGDDDKLLSNKKIISGNTKKHGNVASSNNLQGKVAKLKTIKDVGSCSKNRDGDTKLRKEQEGISKSKKEQEKLVNISEKPKNIQRVEKSGPIKSHGEPVQTKCEHGRDVKSKHDRKTECEESDREKVLKSKQTEELKTRLKTKQAIDIKCRTSDRAENWKLQKKNEVEMNVKIPEKPKNIQRVEKSGPIKSNGEPVETKCESGRNVQSKHDRKTECKESDREKLLKSKQTEVLKTRLKTKEAADIKCRMSDRAENWKLQKKNEVEMNVPTTELKQTRAVKTRLKIEQDAGVTLKMSNRAEDIKLQKKNDVKINGKPTKLKQIGEVQTRLKTKQDGEVKSKMPDGAEYSKLKKKNEDAMNVKTTPDGIIAQTSGRAKDLNLKRKREADKTAQIEPKENESKKPKIAKAPKVSFENIAATDEKKTRNEVTGNLGKSLKKSNEKQRATAKPDSNHKKEIYDGAEKIDGDNREGKQENEVETNKTKQFETTGKRGRKPKILSVERVSFQHVAAIDKKGKNNALTKKPENILEESNEKQITASKTNQKYVKKNYDGLKETKGSKERDVNSDFLKRKMNKHAQEKENQIDCDMETISISKEDEDYEVNEVPENPVDNGMGKTFDEHDEEQEKPDDSKMNETFDEHDEEQEKPDDSKMNETFDEHDGEQEKPDDSKMNETFDEHDGEQEKPDDSKMNETFDDDDGEEGIPDESDEEGKFDEFDVEQEKADESNTEGNFDESDGEQEKLDESNTEETFHEYDREPENLDESNMEGTSDERDRYQEIPNESNIEDVMAENNKERTRHATNDMEELIEEYDERDGIAMNRKNAVGSEEDDELRNDNGLNTGGDFGSSSEAEQDQNVAGKKFKTTAEVYEYREKKIGGLKKGTKRTFSEMSDNSDTEVDDTVRLSSRGTISSRVNILSDQLPPLSADVVKYFKVFTEILQTKYEEDARKNAGKINMIPTSSSTPSLLQSSSMGGNSKIELRHNSNIFVDKDDLEHVLEFTHNQGTMVRMLMRMIVGEEELFKMSALGRGKRPGIPSNVRDVVFRFVKKNRQAGIEKMTRREYIRTLNVMCSTIRSQFKKRKATLSTGASGSEESDTSE